VNSFDGPLPFGGTINWPAAAGGNPGFASGVALPSALSDGLDTFEMPLMDLFEPVEFVSVPASYTAFNQYYEFVTFSNSSDNTNCVASDIYNLFSQVASTGSTYPYSAFTVAAPPSNWLAGIPPMRTLVFCIPANPNSCDLRFEFHRQDGVRFNPNTLGAAFNHTPMKMTSSGEDKMLNSMSVKSLTPTVPSLVSAVTTVAGAVSSNIARGYVPRGIAADIIPAAAQAAGNIAMGNWTQAGVNLGAGFASAARNMSFGRRLAAGGSGRR